MLQARRRAKDVPWMKFPNLTLLVLASSVCLAACKNKDEPETTPPTTQSSGEDTPAEDDEDPEKAKIRISQAVQDMCGITADQANFDFDSANLDAGAKATLDAIAECFLTGPGAGKNLNLVGHADPRGSEEYNFALGQKRAGNVGKYLNGKGLGSARVESSSRGELDSTGTDEASWAEDRFVDILLAE
jgi:peptidoglycan-associated lipoprotein